MRFKIGDVQKFGRVACGDEIPPELVAGKVLTEIARRGFVVLVAFWGQDSDPYMNTTWFKAKCVKVRRARAVRH